MPPQPRKHPFRSLGEFFGHISNAVRKDPTKKTLRKTVDEQQRDGVILRRTTIEEIEFCDRRDMRQ